MKTNLIKEVTELKKENEILKEKNKDYKKILEILDAWFQDTEEENNNDDDMRVY